jgi:basic membrane protein A
LKGPAVLAALFGITLFLGHRAPPPAPNALRVGLVFDVGGLGDKSFNDSAYRGLMRAQKELGVATATLEPGDGDGRASALRMLAASGHALIFGVGFVFTDDLTAMAAEYPNVRFAGIDFAIRDDGAVLPPNLLAIKFREEQGAFLAGALAAMVSETHALGFVGGMDIPLIHKFSAGYRAGVLQVCPSCSVRAMYAGMTPAAFKDPGRGREMALSLYSGGADVVFQAAGSTGLGVFQAAREAHGLAIGVDADQQAEAPSAILTSMVKELDQAVVDTVAETQRGAWHGGVRYFGLRENGMALARNADNARFFTPERTTKLADLRARIERGEIVVPSRD